MHNAGRRRDLRQLRASLQHEHAVSSPHLAPGEHAVSSPHLAPGEHAVSSPHLAPGEHAVSLPHLAQGTLHCSYTKENASPYRR
jgi:hypothetical protein